MTDNEIIKALECCLCMECSECPMNYEDCEERDFESLVKRVLPIFNRQKAEIERYKGVIKILENDVKTSRYEAIREFAEKLKALIGLMNEGDNDYSVTFDYIDNLVKEMSESNV